MTHFIMVIILALFFGLLGATAGFFIGIGVGLLLVDILRISSFEGQSGYFVVFVAGGGCILGFFAAAILTLILHRKFRSDASR